MAHDGKSTSGDRRLRRFVQLQAGLAAYGVSLALMVTAGLGLDPWDVLHQGLAEVTGLRFGWVVNLVGALVLLAWIPLRQRPGLGTISNVLVIGPVAEVALAVLPEPRHLAARGALLVAGVLLNGVATGLYLGARLGPGPRDGLMTGFVARRPGRSIRVVRTAIEVTVLAFGWLLGGTVGVGTALYAAAIGPLAHVFIPLFTVPARPHPDGLIKGLVPIPGGQGGTNPLINPSAGGRVSGRGGRRRAGRP